MVTIGIYQICVDRLIRDELVELSIFELYLLFIELVLIVSPVLHLSPECGSSFLTPLLIIYLVNGCGNTLAGIEISLDVVTMLLMSTSFYIRR